jgi:ketosteroid isomerase-like protein
MLGLAGAPAVEPSTNKVPVADLPGELAQLEHAWNQAHLEADVDALARLCAEDIVVTVPHMKRMTKAGAIGFLRSGRMKFLRYETADTIIHRYGDAAVVTGRLLRSRFSNGQTTDDDWQFTKTYIRQGNTWQVVAFHVSDSP